LSAKFREIPLFTAYQARACEPDKRHHVRLGLRPKKGDLVCSKLGLTRKVTCKQRPRAALRKSQPFKKAEIWANAEQIS